MIEKKEIFIVEQGGERLDSYLSQLLPDFTRSRIQNLIKQGKITVDDQQVKTGYKLNAGQQVVLILEEEAPAHAVAEEIGLDIVYEDHDIIVVNKPQGMVVHPAAGHHSGTLVNALLHHCKDLSGIGGVLRPGIVHRIDKDTSGLLVAAKNDAAYLGLTAQWRKHDIERRYQTLVSGIVSEDSGVVDAPIGRHPRDRKKMAVETKNGRDAITHYQVLERLPFARCSLLEATLETGRTHQIRVHMAYIGYPVLGDPLYGTRKQRYALQGQALHAKVLGFRHPRTGEQMLFDSPLPDYFQALLAEMREPHE